MTPARELLSMRENTPVSLSQSKKFDTNLPSVQNKIMTSSQCNEGRMTLMDNNMDTNVAKKRYLYEISNELINKKNNRLEILYQ